MRQIAPADDRRAWRWVLAITVILTLVRVAVLRASPLELYPDEAQYWLWSRGLAFLAKYAALYAVIGLALHVALDREARKAWSPASAGLALAAFAVAAAPNLAWNASHGFATVAHTAGNANWSAGRHFDPAS